MPKVAIVIASNNYHDDEYEEPKNILEKGGIEVVTVSSKKEVKSKFGKTIAVDMLIDDVNEEDFEGLVFIGGGGSEEYFTNEKALELARQFNAKKKLLGAICLAPVILGHAGVILEKKVTCHPGAEEKLKGTGKESEGKEVVVDGHVVTANGPLAAKQFGETLLEFIQK